MHLAATVATTTTATTTTTTTKNNINKTLISLIHATKTLTQVHQIHAHLIKCGLLKDNSKLSTQLLSASSLKPSPLLHYTISLFHSNPKNSFTFNSLIRGLSRNSHFHQCISHFSLMLRHRIVPDRLTFPFVLKSVSGIGVKGLGGCVHGLVLKCGCESDSFVEVSLCDMYVKIGLLGLAFNVFDESRVRDKGGEFGGGNRVLMWNVVINGCCDALDMDKAMELLEQMPERNTGSWNVLLKGLLKNRELDRAWKVFEDIPEKNVVSWTTMVNGYLQNGDYEKALSVFSMMLEEGVKPNEFTIVSALSACAKIGAVDAGIRIHNYIKDAGFLLNGPISTGLVDMYAKCGNIELASQAFEQTKNKDILTWTAMIWGWAIHGLYDQAIQCFKRMMFASIKPDEVVFLAILSACSHSGQVDLGLNFFESMKLDYSIEPTMKHYALVVDLLGRAGRLDEALKFILDMPTDPDFVIWGALFCACRAHKNTEIAELVSKKLLELEPHHPGSYVFLSNVYAAVGRWDQVVRVRRLMQNRGVEKDPGCSYIEVKGQVHGFVASDHNHKDLKEIYVKLEGIISSAKECGYSPVTDWVLHNIEEEEKEDALGSHSEKLALAFGLLHSSPGTRIRIVKNLRVCGDCHTLMKYASKICQTEIVLRDIKRFHHFKDGSCSCRDYW